MRFLTRAELDFNGQRIPSCRPFGNENLQSRHQIDPANSFYRFCPSPLQSQSPISLCPAESRWLSDLPELPKHQVWRFHYQILEPEHPWAFKDHKPKRRIAALEMTTLDIVLGKNCRCEQNRKNELRLQTTQGYSKQNKWREDFGRIAIAAQLLG